LLEQGKHLMARRQANKAIPLFNEALGLDPDDPDIRFQLGSLARLQGDLKLAFTHLIYCLEKTPERPEVWIRISEVMSYSRNYRDGVALMQRGVERHPQNGRIWWRYGRMLRYNGAHESAFNALQKAVSAQGVRIGAGFDLALTYLAMGDVPKARKALKSIREAAQGELLGMSAAALLEQMHDLALEDTSETRRVAIHLKSKFHHAVLAPGWQACRAMHHTLMTHDVEEVLAHVPDVVVACDSQLVSMRRLIPEASFINTRHGLASKQHSTTNADSADYLCVASEEQAQWLHDRNIAPRKAIWPIGYLQMDPMFRGDVAPIPTGVRDAMPVILFAPTIHETISAMPMLGEDPVEAMRPVAHDAFLIIKPHPEIPQRHPEWMERLVLAAALHENVMLVTDTHAPIDRYLAAADLLVTDCSSVMFQYLALDRPLVLLSNPARIGTSERYDPEGPEWTWRQIGEEVHDVTALPAAILHALSGPAVRAGERAACLRVMYGAFTDGKTGERLAQHIAHLPRAATEPIS
jgi:tetratricopeptide (TPR) repeat protein